MPTIRIRKITTTVSRILQRDSRRERGQEGEGVKRRKTVSVNEEQIHTVSGNVYDSGYVMSAGLSGDVLVYFCTDFGTLSDKITLFFNLYLKNISQPLK